MAKLVGIHLLVIATILLGGCMGVSQTFVPPTPAPTANVPTAFPSPPPPVPTAEGRPTVQDPTLQKLIQDARQDLTQRANVPDSAISVQSAEPVEWRDTSLGCPIEGMMYAQVITPGYLIVLEANGQEYEYHASRTQVVYCDK